MPVVPNRIFRTAGVPHRQQSLLVAGAMLLLALASPTRTAHAQIITGACCTQAGVCELTTQAACPTSSTWRGASTSCTPNLCVANGACCTRTGICTVTTQAACPISSTWRGAGAPCDPNPCPQPPVLREFRFLAPTDTLPDGRLRPLVGDDTIDLLTRWEFPDAEELVDSLTVTADFSRLDPLGPGVPGNRVVQVRREDGGGGRYRVTYTLSGSRRDSSGIRIPLLAVARRGTDSLRAEDRRIEVCLSNHPPVHLSSRLIRSQEPPYPPYRSGDSVIIETKWESHDNLALRITADFSEVDTLHLRPPGADRNGGVFLVRYRLPLAKEDMLPDGSGKLIPITARDAGCGVTTDASVRIDIDTEPPPSDLVRLDPLPAVTSAESLVVSGEAPQADRVLLLRNKAWQETVLPDPNTGRFSGGIELLFGENRIQVRTEDASGNGTLPYPASPRIVTRLEAATLVVGTPYSRKDRPLESADDIALRNPVPMTGVVLRIFNLEGDCIWEERPDPATLALEHRFHWEGTDRAGDRAPQGYYLIRAEWRGSDGKGQSITKGLLLRD